MHKKFIAIDPGSEKTGLAIMSFNGDVITIKVVPTKELAELVQIDSAGIKTLVIGNGTNSKNVIADLTSKTNLEIIVVEEKHSTEEARNLYWKMNPPTGIKRLLPEGLRVPGEPVDGYAAVVLGKRYLANL